MKREKKKWLEKKKNTLQQLKEEEDTPDLIYLKYFHAAS